MQLNDAGIDQLRLSEGTVNTRRPSCARQTRMLDIICSTIIALAAWREFPRSRPTYLNLEP